MMSDQHLLSLYEGVTGSMDQKKELWCLFFQQLHFVFNATVVITDIREIKRTILKCILTLVQVSKQLQYF